MAENTDPKGDLRVRRTRKLLLQAMMDLTVEKGFAAITVRDITERAMVNRSTFYRHYLDKYDLLDRYMEEVYTLTGEDEAADRPAAASKDLPGPITLLRHIQQYADFYRVMLGPQGDQWFTQGLRQHSERRFRTLLAHQAAPPDPSGPPLDLRLHYVSYAGIGAILWWLDNGQPCSAEQLARWLSQLSTTNAGLTLPFPARED